MLSLSHSVVICYTVPIEDIFPHMDSDDAEVAVNFTKKDSILFSELIHCHPKPELQIDLQRPALILRNKSLISIIAAVVCDGTECVVVMDKYWFRQPLHVTAWEKVVVQTLKECQIKIVYLKRGVSELFVFEQLKRAINGSMLVRIKSEPCILNRPCIHCKLYTCVVTQAYIYWRNVVQQVRPWSYP